MKLEVGSTYYDADGQEVEIIYKDDNDPVYTYQGDNHIFYMSSGRTSAMGSHKTDLQRRKGTMTKEEFFEFVESEAAELVDLMRAKNADYTAGGGPFANFEGAQDFGITPIQGLLLRLSDKFQRVKSFAKNGQLEVQGEGVEDAFRDIIGYSYLALGMLNDNK